MTQPVLPRRIVVRAKDASGVPIRGARFEWRVNGEVAGAGELTDGHSDLEVTDPGAVVTVSAEVGGIRREAVRLAANAQQYEFRFDEIDQFPAWQHFVRTRFPVLTGVMFVLLTITLAFVFGRPTRFQTNIMYATFALGGGAFSSWIAGEIRTDLTVGKKLTISAGGAAAIFVILYFFRPDLFG
jgi:hypothetical protein